MVTATLTVNLEAMLDHEVLTLFWAVEDEMKKRGIDSTVPTAPRIPTDG